MLGDLLASELRDAEWRYTFGLDTRKDREILREMGGMRYWHLEPCECAWPFDVPNTEY